MGFFEQVVGFFFDNGYALELLFAFSIFAFCFERRRFFVLRYLLVFLLLLACSLVWNSLGIDETPALAWIKYLVMISVGGAGVLFCTKATFWSALFCVVGGVATQHLYFRSITLILSFTPFGYESVFRIIITVALFAAVYGSVFLLFRKPLKEAAFETRRSDRVNVLLGLGIVIFAIILHLFEGTYDFMETDPSLLSALSAYGVLCCLFTLGLQYNLFRSDRLSVDKAVLEALVEKQKEQYEHSKETIDFINVKCHDMKRQISLLESRVEPEALDEIKKAIKIYETTYYTGNEVLDVFLAERGISFEKNGIQFNCIADGACIDFMKPSEIYALFGNAVDNAVEALLAVPEEDRIFTLSVKRKLDMVVIHAENVYNASLVFRDGLPQTTKDDLNSHGFGMQSIRMVAEKYRGSVTVHADGGIFNLNVLLPVPDTAQIGSLT